MNGNLIESLESRRLMSVTVADGSFEVPSLPSGSFKYNVTGTAWKFVGNAAITSNGSIFSNTNAPNGKQVAVLQTQSSGPATSISQSISGFAAATTYTISFYEEGRNYPAGFANTFEVLLDNTVIVPSRVPKSLTAFDLVTASFTVATAGTHTLTFKSLGPADTGGRGGEVNDRTTFIDNVSIAVASTGAVRGSVFNDPNANGKKDAGEAGLSGWLVYLDANNNGQFDPGEQSVVTSSTGTFTMNLKPGKYTLSVQIRRAFTRRRRTR